MPAQHPSIASSSQSTDNVDPAPSPSPPLTPALNAVPAATTSLASTSMSKRPEADCARNAVTVRTVDTDGKHSNSAHLHTSATLIRQGEPRAAATAPHNDSRVFPSAARHSVSYHGEHPAGTREEASHYGASPVPSTSTPTPAAEPPLSSLNSKEDITSIQEPLGETGGSLAQGNTAENSHGQRSLATVHPSARVSTAGNSLNPTQASSALRSEDLECGRARDDNRDLRPEIAARMWFSVFLVLYFTAVGICVDARLPVSSRVPTAAFATACWGGMNSMLMHGWPIFERNANAKGIWLLISSAAPCVVAWLVAWVNANPDSS
ncbi:hypothetical protein EXIGLDRAFT_766814 [Exidia glandulosa HHB12029]|uniref:Uncharacterized protein n=1 Tax=Exidia glandulosa HHB12029 TaxID=1314781 RepID=A0A165JG24_EXIGL|nr:hypothetical protein EXIGLDRAFT_766814 [Exidia glandulosa HHB12029]